MSSAQKPIGYWLRRADEAITSHADRVLSEHGLTRAHWQMLNVLAERGGVTPDQLLATLGDFVDRSGLDRVAGDLTARGWLRPAPRLQLTEAGVEGHREVSGLVQAVRRRAAEGISEADYLTVIATLERMVANLEGASTPA